MPTIIVVGAGNAGIPAAIEAADRGARVILIEKTDQLGGMLHWSSATMSAAGARLQKARGILDDSPAKHAADCLRIGRGRPNPDILRVVTEGAAETIDWLEAIGVPFTDDSPKDPTEHEAYRIPRSFYPNQPAATRPGGFRGGGVVFDRLYRELEKRLATGAIDVHLNTIMTGLALDGDRVTGVISRVVAGDPAGAPREEVLRGDAVILTTGGYLANAALVHQLHPQYDRAITLCGPHATGDAIPLILGIGGLLENQDILLLLQGYFEDPDAPGFCLPGGSLRVGRPPATAGDIWINRRGERFLREDEVSPDAREQALMAQPGAVTWAIFDDLMRQGFTQTISDFTRRLGHQGLVVSAPTIADLAVAIGVPAEALAATIADYNAGQAKGRDRFGRAADAMPAPIEHGPFHAIRSDGATILSFAGIKVTDRLEVARADGSPIAGLYAAGEILGAGQTNGAAFCSGMGAGPAITTGRLAVRNALARADA